MRKTLIALVAGVALATSGAAYSAAAASNTASLVVAAAAPTCSADYYKNVDGICVHRPAQNPRGATAQCRDGTWSYSRHASGTCSHHGGVRRWIHHP